MALQLVKKYLPMLHKAGSSLHSAKRSYFASNNISDRPLSFCEYRYWSKLSHKDCTDSLQLVNHSDGLFKRQPTRNLDVRPFSTSNFCSHQITKSNNYSGVSDSDKAKHPKTKKSSVKEFTIKDKIGEHDMAIKLTKVQNLLTKGKTVAIFVKHGSQSKSNSSNPGRKSQMQEKLQEHLQGVQTLRTDYSNEHTTRFTLVPAPSINGNENTPEAESDAANAAKENTS